MTVKLNTQQDSEKYPASGIASYGFVTAVCSHLLRGETGASRNPQMGSVTPTKQNIKHTMTTNKSTHYLAMSALLVSMTAAPQVMGAFQQLNVGDAPDISGTFAAVTGSVINKGSASDTFSYGTSFVGSLDTQVWANDTSNPYGLSALTFVYTLKNTGLPTDSALKRISFDGWYSTQANVANSVGVAAYSADRDNLGLSGNIGFNFEINIIEKNLLKV